MNIDSAVTNHICSVYVYTTIELALAIGDKAIFYCGFSHHCGLIENDDQRCSKSLLVC